MNGRYLIDNKVEFNCSACTLRSVDKDISFTLLAASSECFHFLLQNHGSLVNKSKLTYEGWEKYGLHVSDNTFYQNVLIIRKGLKACGIDYEVIKTLPRKGLLIPESIDIKKIVDNTAGSPREDSPAETSSDTPRAVESSPSKAFFDAFATQQEVESPKEPEATKALPGEESPTASIAAVEDVTNLAEDSQQRDARPERVGRSFFASKFHLSVRCTCGLVAGAAMIAYGVFCGYLMTSGTNYFEKYIPINTMSSCHILASANQRNAGDIDELLSEYNIRCDKDKYMYFTRNDFIKRVSIIRCERPLGVGNNMSNCISYYVLDNEYEV